jgi:prolipoprotein diacylglyceryl transferase
MNPVAFEIFGLEIRWYGILMATAMLLGTLLVMKRGKKEGFTEDDILDLVLRVIPASVIGARLYYVIFNWGYYSKDLIQILNLRGGGLAIHGGIIGGIIAGYFFCKKRKLNMFALMDLIAPALILGQAIGRWGNFANGEAHGGPSDLPWAITVRGEKVHPTFLYESICNFLIFIYLMKYSGKKKFEGEVFLLYMGLYSVGRFFIEGLRTDSLMLGPLRVAQVISLIFIVISVTGIIFFRNKRKNV